MEQNAWSLPGSILSLAVAPTTTLENRWESLRVTDDASRRPLVRNALRGLLIALSLRGAAQEAPACALDCQHQFCYRSCGCLAVPLTAIALLGMYGDFSPVAKVSMSTIGSLGVMSSTFISLVHCARDYLYDDEDASSPEIRSVIGRIKDLLHSPHTADQV